MTAGAAQQYPTAYRTGALVSLKILITNDDGIEAPGLGALAQAVRPITSELLVAAPLSDYSGASAAVGAVYERASVDFKPVELDGLDGVPCYGVDASPALTVLLAFVGAFGSPPDAVLSGINHGANIGRAVLHSGTIGAALTAAHFGASAIAVSIRFGPEPIPWKTPAMLARETLKALTSWPPGTVLNLNTPNVALSDLVGIARGSLGHQGMLRAAAAKPGTGWPRLAVTKADTTSPAPGSITLQTQDVGAPAGDLALPPPQRAALLRDSATLRYVPAAARTSAQDSTPTPGEKSTPPATDVELLAANYASITPLVATREATDAVQPGVANLVAELLTNLNAVRR